MDFTSLIRTAESLSNHLSIFHLNVQSMLPKLDLLRCEVDAYDIAVFFFFLKAGLNQALLTKILSLKISCLFSGQTGVIDLMGV